jgi:hypothetical protein
VLDPFDGPIAASGPTDTEYPIKTVIKTKNFDDSEDESEVDHTLTIKNPCIDPAKVKINLPATLESVEYIVETGLE